MLTVRERVANVARALTRLVPDRVLARIMPRNLRWDPDAMVVATRPAGAVRLYIAPANSAGQAFRWARAAEENLRGVGAVNLMVTDAGSELYRFPADVRVPAMGFVFAAQWQRRQRAELLAGFTHMLLESGRFAYGSVPGSSPLRVAQHLADGGLDIALLWHGSDIRIPSRHAETEPESPFGPNGGYPQKATAVLERNARQRMRMIEDSDYPVFVSTPGLLDVPRSRWLPVVVEIERWTRNRPAFAQERPVVAYAPSSSLMKGSPAIDEELRGLEREGLITYRRVEAVPSDEMPSVYSRADIVLDQFRLGDYGVAACEAMAAGCTVVGHVAESVRETVRTLTGRELPIVESLLADVGSTVRRLVAEPEASRAMAEDGRRFVAEVHDGRHAARALADFLQIPASDAPAVGEVPTDERPQGL